MKYWLFLGGLALNFSAAAGWKYSDEVYDLAFQIANTECSSHSKECNEQQQLAQKWIAYIKKHGKEVTPASATFEIPASNLPFAHLLTALKLKVNGEKNKLLTHYKQCVVYEICILNYSNIVLRENLETEYISVRKLLQKHHVRYKSLVNNYGSMLLRGIGGEQDIDGGVALLINNSFEPGISMFNIASFYFDVGNYKYSLRYFEKAMNLGDKDALIHYARHYQFGLGTEINLQLAKDILLDEYTKSSDIKVGYYLFILLYDNPNLGSSSLDLVKLLRDAATKKLPIANLDLGRFYFNGILVKKDLVRAKTEFEFAWVGGEVDGLYYLSITKLVLKESDSCDFIHNNIKNNSRLTVLYNKYCEKE
ncbi:tetratricopeptide repeat protein [uncultured Psychrosphaera sp.]|uniref:tetratricopeptide repeat protein n=1 Tax=uncultured Psychrosphaera sp. TaxID=1403522 RepID=UPI00262C6D69|nr:tetratricopeptide repeat protein [uncultured Psychrosphaera sp.]